MTQEALKLALDALEACNRNDMEEVNKAITAIKKALAQEQEPWCMKMNGCKTKCEDCPDEPPDICCQQYDTCLKPCTPRGVHLAQPEQEPSGHFLDFAYSDSIAYVHVYDQFRKGQQFYKAPPKRTWVGLTDVEIDYLLGSTVGENEETHISFARAIEALLKQKNHVAQKTD
jgi:hypothetical protein